MKSIFLLVCGLFICIGSFLFAFSNPILASCSTDGATCALGNDSSCRPTGSSDCATYTCQNVTSGDNIVFNGVCKPAPTSTPSCSKKGSSCSIGDNSSCQAAGESGCQNYGCVNIAGDAVLPRGACEFLAPTPTPPPEPVCTKKQAFCSSDQDCRPEGENGCGSYACLPTSDNLFSTRCIYKPGSAALPTPTSFPPPCATLASDGKCSAVNTAIGPIDTDPAKFIGKIFAIVLSISGGIALILIISSGYRFMTSQGNQEAIQGARETLTSAIIGLLFIIFALVFLQVIGVTILQIPGLGK